MSRKENRLDPALTALRDVERLNEDDKMKVDVVPGAFRGSEEVEAVLDFTWREDAVPTERTFILVKLYRVKSPLGTFIRADIQTVDGHGMSAETMNVYNEDDAEELREIVETSIEIALKT